jgi:hypothetical protein
MKEHFDLIIAIIALLGTAGGVVASVYALVERKVTPLQCTADTTAKAVVEIRTGLYGATGQNGLRSDVRELQHDVKAFREELTNVRIQVAHIDHESE